MKKQHLISLVIVILVIGGLVALQKSSPTKEEIITEKGGIVSQNGIHWHPELEIFVKGEKKDIPENIGLIGLHSPVHTHEDLPIIHLEFGGEVREGDIKLIKFFEVWKKDPYEFGQNVTMTVNGEINEELFDYVMGHEDKIILNYE